MSKFNPIYRVTVYSNQATVIVKDPITCKINIDRGLLSDAVKATVQLYNLAPSTRDLIFQDPWTFDWDKQKYVHIEAGYGEDETAMSMVFKGRILQAYSRKAGGQVDVITTIEAQALDILDCQSSYTFTAGTSYMDAVKTIVNDMPNVTIANVGEFEGVFQTETTMDGNAIELINTITHGHAYIDNGMLNILLNNEVLEVPVPVITDKNGLLDTPVRKDANLEVKMLFEPSLLIGQLLEIQSDIAPRFNGQYKVIGINHDCLFSETQGGNRTTSVNLHIGPLLPGANLMLTDGTIQTNFKKVKGTTVSNVNYSKLDGWVRPAPGSITSYFGKRVHPIYKQVKYHSGIDIGCSMNTSVQAAYSGTISFAGISGSLTTGYGRLIIIDHGTVNGKKTSSYYGHLNSFCCSAGQKVNTGQIIAKSGSSGGSTGPHLHFEIRANNTAVNPLNYISSRKG